LGLELAFSYILAGGLLLFMKTAEAIAVFALLLGFVLISNVFGFQGVGNTLLFGSLVMVVLIVFMRRGSRETKVQAL
jgi:hypothetical protein